MSEREVELVYKVHDHPYVEGHKPTQFVKRFHVLTGLRGAVTFGWIMRPEDESLIRELERTIGSSMWPMGVDVGCHRRVRRSEWESEMDCEWLGGKCYYDGSSLRANEWLEEFQRRDYDEEWLRAMLREEYAARFESDGGDPIAEMGFSQVITQLFGGDS